MILRLHFNTNTDAVLLACSALLAAIPVKNSQQHVTYVQMVRFNVYYALIVVKPHIIHITDNLLAWYAVQGNMPLRKASLSALILLRVTTNPFSASQCLDCPGGYYCPDNMTVTPISCPSGSCCPKGCSDPITCSFLHDAGSGQTVSIYCSANVITLQKCEPTAALYVLIAFGVVLVILIMVGVWRLAAYRHKKEKARERKLEIEQLIPKPPDGPQYTGL